MQDIFLYAVNMCCSHWQINQAALPVARYRARKKIQTEIQKKGGVLNRNGLTSVQEIPPRLTLRIKFLSQKFWMHHLNCSLSYRPLLFLLKRKILAFCKRHFNVTNHAKLCNYFTLTFRRHFVNTLRSFRFHTKPHCQQKYIVPNLFHSRNYVHVCTNRKKTSFKNPNKLTSEHIYRPKLRTTGHSIQLWI